MEYRDNYSDTSGSLWQFKRDKQDMNNRNILVGVNSTNSTSFEYKSSFIKKSDDEAFKNVKIAVPLKYLNNFWRYLENSLINCKIHFKLNLSKNCVMSNVNGATKSKTTKTKLYVPIITLSSKDNLKLIKLSEEGFNRSVYWNEYQTKIKTKDLDNNNFTRLSLDSSFQGVKRLFVLAFKNTDDNANKVEKNKHGKYFLPRVNITSYNVLIDGRNFYDFNDLVKQNHKIATNIATKIATGQGDDYTIGCLLDYQYFKDHFKLIAIDLSKHKELDSD